jgi:ABC-2 type transport system permease protein
MGIKKFLLSAFAIAEMEIRKLRHNSTELWIRAIQPIFWLVIFGNAMSQARGISTGEYTYLQFITPGVLAQSVLFIAIFYGITLVWERDVGLMSKLLATPSPRSAIITGKALSAGIRGIFQAITVFILALIMGISLHISIGSILGVLLFCLLIAMLFSCFSMLVASLLKTRDRMMGIGQAMTMPLFFASNAIYPIELMPNWLQIVALGNPLTYAVEGMRVLLLTENYSTLWLDFLVPIIWTIVLIIGASIVLKRIIE